MIRVVCKAKLKPGVNVEEYLNVARKVVEETRKEEGCIMYTLNEDINDPSIYDKHRRVGESRSTGST